jgi:hypothetical protein
MGKPQWWVGKTDEQIKEHYKDDSDGFFQGTGNYAHKGGHVRFGGREFDCVASTGGDVLDTLVAEEASALETSSEVKRMSILAALAVYDARDKRRRLEETARAMMECETHPNGTAIIDDLARVLGISHPSALGRVRTLTRVVTTDDEFKAILASSQQ